MQEKIWKDMCEEQVDRNVCNYLRTHDLQYQQLQEKEQKLIEQYPVIVKLIDSGEELQISAEEHQALHEYLQIRDAMEQIERQYHFYYGQSQAVTYRWMLERIKQGVDFKCSENSKAKDSMVELLMERRVDMAEKDCLSTSQAYRDCVEEVKQCEKAFQQIILSEKEGKIFDDYVSALIAKYILRGDYMYRYGMRDAMILFHMIE